MSAILRWLYGLAAHFLRTLDAPLMAALLALMAIGLAVLYSAGGGSTTLVMAQGARFAVGMGAMWALSRVPPTQLRNWTPPVYAVTLIPLLLVLVVGEGKHGNHWINLGVFYFQPAELLKLSLPMMVAWYLNTQPLPPRFNVVLVAAVIIAVPTLLILKQPDFGTAMLVASSGAFALYLAGLPWWWFGAAFAGVAAIAMLGSPPLAVSAAVALVLLLRRPVARHFGPEAAYALWAVPAARLILPPLTLPIRPVPFPPPLSPLFSQVLIPGVGVTLTATAATALNSA